MLDDRAKLLLKVLVERYIADGQPIGSRTLSRSSGLELSPATIRNVMADLEELGLIASPHTSAGRIPTARGYRLFVDTMLTAQRQALVAPQLPAEQPQKVIANAAHLLSNLSQFVGVVMAPKRSSVFKQIEFVELSERRVLVIIVAPDGDVQNRVMFTDSELDSSQLIEAANYLNSHYAGLDIEQVRERLRTEVEQLRSQVADLMQAAVNISAEALSPATQEEQVVIAGQSNLLAVSDFSTTCTTCAARLICLSKKPKSCACSNFPARPKACASSSAAKATSCPLRSCPWSAPPMRWTAKSSAPWA